MPGTLKLNTFARTQIVGSELNALANGSGAALTAAFSNASNLYLVCLFELNVTFTTAPTLDNLVELYALPQTDGTNWATYTSGASPVAPLTCLAASFPCKANTSLQVIPSRPFVLGPFSYKFGVVNRCGVAFPASGATIAIAGWIEQYT